MRGGGESADNTLHFNWYNIIHKKEYVSYKIAALPLTLRSGLRLTAMTRGMRINLDG